MKKLKWRVVYGYQSNEYLSIGEEELEKAKYAMVSGKLFNSNSKTVRGSEIKRIEPDIRFYTGWFDNYEPCQSEDFKQIERDVPVAELQERSDLADTRVRYALNKNQPSLLTNPEQLDKLLLE